MTNVKKWIYNIVKFQSVSVLLALWKDIEAEEWL